MGLKVELSEALKFGFDDISIQLVQADTFAIKSKLPVSTINVCGCFGSPRNIYTS
jgi:hypothetical protein